MRVRGHHRGRSGLLRDPRSDRYHPSELQPSELHRIEDGHRLGSRQPDGARLDDDDAIDDKVRVVHDKDHDDGPVRRPRRDDDDRWIDARSDRLDGRLHKYIDDALQIAATPGGSALERPAVSPPKTGSWLRR